MKADRWEKRKPPSEGRFSLFGCSTLIEDHRGGVPQPLLSNYYCLSCTPPPHFVGLQGFCEAGLSLVSHNRKHFVNEKQRLGCAGIIGKIFKGIIGGSVLCNTESLENWIGKVSALGFGAMRLPVLDNDSGKINVPLATQMVPLRDRSRRKLC